MKVMCWVKHGYRKQTRAIFYACSILSETEKEIIFLMPDGKKHRVKHNDLISIEKEEGA